MNNSLLENDKLPESISSPNINDIDGLRRQLKEQHIRSEERFDSVCTLPPF